MATCIQFVSPKGPQTVLDHGNAVYAKYEELLQASLKGEAPPGWRLPKWWTSDLAKDLAGRQPDGETMRRYLLYHDCGKPYCLTKDESGRSHFPGHAQLSAEIWRQLGGAADECWLMARDMLLHTGSAVECEALKGERLAPGLLFAALAEVHSNAEMFGGVETDSFKAKVKQLERRGKGI